MKSKVLIVLLVILASVSYANQPFSSINQDSLDEVIDQTLDQAEVKGIKRWIFKRKLKQVTRKLKKGQKVKVYYYGDNLEQFTVKGDLRMITENHVTLQTPGGMHLNIANESIYKIKYISGLKLLFGLLISGALLFILSFSGGYLGYFLGYLTGGLGCLFIIALAIGLPISIALSKESIDLPFKGGWEITAEPTEKKVQAFKSGDALWVPFN